MYHVDKDDEYENRLNKKRFDEQVFLLRDGNPDKDYVERILVLLWKRDWKLSNEVYDAQLNKEFRIKKRYELEQQLKKLDNPPTPVADNRR